MTTANPGDASSAGAEPHPVPEGLLEQEEGCFRYSFRAMASPCEIRVDTDDASLATAAGQIAAAEAGRIENKFSRYHDDSVIGHINRANGSVTEVDPETADLLDFASHCFAISNGRFDITSGILRRAWIFDGSSRIPDEAVVRALRPLIGWDKVHWHRPALQMPFGMEIDLGGIGKEYAVDRAVDLIARGVDVPVLVNFGGDLRISGPRRSGERWLVAIESVEQAGTTAGLLEITQGALATSGDTKRFVMRNGVRLGHIFNPKTGKPVVDPPRSVTVTAATCLEAGMLATLAILNGRNAEKFLKRERVRAWCIR